MNTYSVFAFNATDEVARDERRAGIPEWKLSEAIRWATTRRGFDSVFIQLSGEPASSDLLTTHHVCTDPWCPGGCE